MTSPARSVRPLLADDAPAIVAMLRAQPTEYIRFFHALPVDESALARVLSERERDAYHGLFEDDRVVGLFMLRGWDAGYEIPSFGLLVDAHARGKGYLHRTLEMADQLCREAGATRFMAKIHPENLSPDAAHRLQLIQVGVEAGTGNVIYHRLV